MRESDYDVIASPRRDSPTRHAAGPGEALNKVNTGGGGKRSSFLLHAGGTIESAERCIDATPRRIIDGDSTM
jgi:hypothetical protein